jgi:hypothetical protein
MVSGSAPRLRRTKSQATVAGPNLRRGNIVSGDTDDVLVTVIGGRVEGERALARSDANLLLARLERPLQPWLHLSHERHPYHSLCSRPALTGTCQRSP